MKRVASLSLDLDNHWSYLKTHGDSGWEDFPSYLDIVIPRVLDILAARKLKISFFIVGQDAALEKNHHALSLLQKEGHEIGNHSFHHEPWMHLNTAQEVHAELEQAEAAIEQATGVRPKMFRGPGFCLSKTVLEVLAQRSYLFDASTNPTYLGPLARAYFLRTANLKGEERAKRAKLFGTFKDGLQPTRPYRWELNQGKILEIPVTTIPGLKLPFHLSYILYLSSFSTLLASAYLHFSLSMCRMANLGPSLLLHPLDFLGAEDVQGLDFFPGMNIPVAQKLERVGHYLDFYAQTFRVLAMGDFAQELTHSENSALVVRRL